ncbi:unnamed protein product [Symbiodinium natans]|uniref:Uncharacterized protein n=1 Tax=Symbiodinium natans TaxID=878477 RepID=A0A812UZL2_9DINO|nr:unnamed protein product [Symbiodinium natans]
MGIYYFDFYCYGQRHRLHDNRLSLMDIMEYTAVKWEGSTGSPKESREKAPREPMEELEESGESMEDFGEEEEPDMDEEDIGELEDMPEAEGPSGKMSNHPLYEDCIRHAEEVETSVGLYDNVEVGEEGRKSLAAALKAKAVTLTKKDSPTFESAFASKLEEIHSSKGGFGASDACDFLLEHHEEL